MTGSDAEVERMPTVRVRFEQAVYGSFPFWDRGYALLAHSPGCRPEWLAEFAAVVDVPPCDEDCLIRLIQWVDFSRIALASRLTG